MKYQRILVYAALLALGGWMLPPIFASAGTAVVPDGDRANDSSRPLPELEIVLLNFTGPGYTSAEIVPADGELPYWDFGSPPLMYRVEIAVPRYERAIACVSAKAVQPRFAFSKESLMIAGKDRTGAWRILPRESHPASEIICGSAEYLGDIAVVQPFGLPPRTFARIDDPNPQALAAVRPAGRAAPHAHAVSFPGISGGAVLFLANNPAHPVIGGRVRLNGETVVSAGMFGKHSSDLTVPVMLRTGGNLLEVEIDGGPESSLTVSIR